MGPHGERCAPTARQDLEQYLTRQKLNDERGLERQQAYRAAVAPAAKKQICCMCGFMKFFEDERMHRCTLADVVRRLPQIADGDSLATRAKVNGTLYPLNPAGLPPNVDDHSLSSEVYLRSTTDVCGLQQPKRDPRVFFSNLIPPPKIP